MKGLSVVQGKSINAFAVHGDYKVFKEKSFDGPKTMAKAWEVILRFMEKDPRNR